MTPNTPTDPVEAVARLFCEARDQSHDPCPALTQGGCWRCQHYSCRAAADYREALESAGWQVVPKVPSNVHISQALANCGDNPRVAEARDGARQIYRVMLQAAPTLEDRDDD